MSDKFDDYDDEDKLLEDEYFDEDEPTEDDYEDEQESPNSRKGALNKSSEKEEDKPDEEYENVCFICRRPERIRGKAKDKRVPVTLPVVRSRMIFFSFAIETCLRCARLDIFYPSKISFVKRIFM